MKKKAKIIDKRALTSPGSEKGLRPPFLGSEDVTYGHKLASLTPEDRGKLIEALRKLKPAEEAPNFDEIRDKLGL